MLLTKEQSLKRLNSQDNIINKVSNLELEIPEIVIKDGKNHLGRAGSRNLTEEEKIAIAVIAKTTSNEVAADLMGVSEHTVGHLRTGQTTLSHGANTQRYGQNQDLKNKIEERLNSTKMSIQERAAEKLLGALGLLSDDKLENCTAKDLAQITNQMSQVVRNISNNGNNDKGKTAGVKIVLHQPKSSREESFDIIEVSAR